MTMRPFPFLWVLRRALFRTWLPLVLFAGGPVPTWAAPAYVQGNYAVPQLPETTVTVPYMAAQIAGDLNVVIIGWNDSAAQVSSVKDTKGNVYQLVVGPMVTGALSQAIYSAKNIAAAPAATNVVTVTFNGAATYPDIRLAEYSGIDPANPVDTFVGATGNSGTSSSGAVTTTNSTDLLVAGNMVQTSTNAAGSGFTLRSLTVPDGDIAEDQNVTVAGTYSASTPLSSPGGWIMQMVAYRAGSSAPAPTPNPTPTPTPTPGKIAFVQANYAVPQTAQSEVTVPYTAAQTNGNLNVVIVGWSDSSVHVNSLTDSGGNVYQLAIGPTVVPGSLSQVIYYAANIGAARAGANAVTLTFDGPATFSDIRILEYGGIDPANPVDAVMGATSSTATSSSGTVTTSNASDLLVAGNTVQTGTAGAGSGFSQRLLTNPDGDIVEDEIVSVSGSYNASAPLSGAGASVMQMVAFQAAGSGGSLSPTPTPTPAPTPTPSSTPTPTPTPTPAPTPSPNPNPGLTLAWNANQATGNSATSTAGYRVHMGSASGVYTQTTDVGNTTSCEVSNLESGTTYYFVVTAYDSAGLDSPPSNEVSQAAP
jgi:hypothetical protein